MAEESGLLLVLWSFISLCMTGVSILFYTKMHQQLFRLLSVFLLSPITFLLFQFSVTVFCFNEALRAFVSILIWIRYRGKATLSKDGSDSVWDHKGKGNTRMVLVPVILSQKAVLFEHNVATEFEKRLFGDSNSNPLYRKLKSVIFTFCGYVSWREVNDFNVRNHVRTLRRTEIYTEKDVTELLSHTCQDMDSKQPQWEILIIRRFFDETDGQEKSMLIFRFHHAYMDGISLLMMLDKLSEDFNYQFNPLTSGLPTWKMAFHYFNALIFGSLQLVHIVLNSFRTHWIANGQISSDHKGFAWLRNQIPLESVQKIRMESKAPIANILGLAFVESCRRILPQDRLVKDVVIGEVMAILPYPDSKPQNRFTAFSYTADTAPEFVSTFSLNERLQALKEEANDAVLGPQPIFVYYLIKLIGRLPKMLYPLFMTGTQDSLYLSSIPCSKDKFTLFQGQCEGLGAFPPCFKDTGIMLATVTYGKWINICVTADAAWLSQDEVSSILCEVPKVIDELVVAAGPVNHKVKVDLSVHDAPSLPNLPEEEVTETRQEEDVKVSISDSSDLSAQSQENLTDSHKDDENQNQMMKKKKIRSRNKVKAGGPKAL